MQRDDSSPEAYRADVDGELSSVLEHVRSLVLQFADEADETIEYGMLAYPGIGNLAAQKNYVALYVAPQVLDNYRDRFADCGKSCIRFRYLNQVHDQTLRSLLTHVRQLGAA